MQMSRLKQTVKFGENPMALLEKGFAEYGDVFATHIPGDPERIWLAHPDAVRQLFALRRDAYENYNNVPINIGESSVLFSDGEPHRKARSQLRKPFKGERMRAYGQMMLEAARTRFEALTPGRKLAMHPLLQELTLDIIVRCVFGVSEGERVSRIKTAIPEWLDAGLSPASFMASLVFTGERVRRFLDWRAQRHAQGDSRVRDLAGRFLPWERMSAAKAVIDTLLVEEIERFRAHPDDTREDILAVLLRDSEDTPNVELVSTLVTLLVGGHETTANALSWVVYYVATRPEVLARIREEIEEVYGDRPVDPTTIGDLRYLDAVLQESMRLMPISIAVVRRILHDMTLCGYHVPAGSYVNACTWLVHRRTDLWDDALSFRPERFYNTAKPPPHHFFPFGAGARICIGKAFAEYEMRLVLAELLRNHTLALDPQSSVQPQMRGITLTPSDGLRVVVHKGPSSS